MPLAAAPVAERGSSSRAEASGRAAAAAREAAVVGGAAELEVVEVAEEVVAAVAVAAAAAVVGAEDAEGAEGEAIKSRLPHSNHQRPNRVYSKITLQNAPRPPPPESVHTYAITSTSTCAPNWRQNGPKFSPKCAQNDERVSC